MIFATIGTTAFSALVKVVDDLSPILPEPIILQIGRIGYDPQHCKYFRFAPSLTPYYERASLVISHGVLGTVSDLMRGGYPLVAVEDPGQPDRHQRQILEVWEKAGHLIWCKDLRRLSQAIEQAKSYHFTPYVPPECQIHTIIAEFLDSLG